MADVGITLTRDTARTFVCEGDSVHLAAEPRLGVAKLMVMVDEPDIWFADTLGIAAPAVSSEIEVAAIAFAWLAPGEWLVTGREEDVAAVCARCRNGVGALGLMIDFTHARASFQLSGSDARSVLAAHSPLDVSHAAMPVGAAARSMFTDTGFFVSRRPDRDDQPTFRLIFDQTMAEYAGRLLSGTINGIAR